MFRVAHVQIVQTHARWAVTIEKKTPIVKEIYHSMEISECALKTKKVDALCSKIHLIGNLKKRRPYTYEKISKNKMK